MLLLSGCYRVYVPVYSCPVPVLGSDPVLPIGELTETSTYGEVVNAYSASVEACKGRVAELKIKLNAYMGLGNVLK
jgi:hypothetical protein